MDDISNHIQSYSNQSLDLVVAADVWIYVGALENVFSCIQQKLRPNGLFVFSIELGTQEDVRLAPTGRFQHRFQYIERLATIHGMQLLGREHVSIRMESYEPIPGEIFVLQTTQ